MYEMQLVEKMPDEIISRKQILNLAREIEPDFSEGMMKQLLSNLLHKAYVVRVGRNQYCKADKSQMKQKYKCRYSKKAEEILDVMEASFPMVDFRVWELSCLNEFFDHQVGQNYIFLEVEKDGCEFVFDKMIEKYPGNVLLKPDINAIMRYAANGTILIENLITEAPKGQENVHYLSLEKLIVDLFANKNLRNLISQGDYQNALENIFFQYEVDQVKMLRYARRRNKEKEVREYLTGNTRISLR